MRIVALALALLISANAAKAEIITMSTLALGGGIAWVWKKVTKVEQKQATLEADSKAMRSDLDSLGTYVASKPWQADIEAYNASKPVAPAVATNQPIWMPRTSPMAVGRKN